MTSMPSARGLALAAVAATLLVALVAPARADTIEVGARDDLQISDVQIAGNRLTGTVTNRTRKEVKDVSLLVTRSFLWRDEKNPGPINPGGSYFFKMPVTIAPGASAKFSFELPFVDAPSDLGTFHTTVAVQEYTEVEYVQR